MVTLAEIMIISFIVGFSGAASPGPLLIVSIRDTLSGTWRNGIVAVVAHGVFEGLIIIGIVTGMRVVEITSPIANGIATVGGIILVGFGLLTIKDIPDIKLESELLVNEPQSLIRSFRNGVVATISNGFWWIWWFSAGLVVVTRALPLGSVGMGLTGIAHWLSDLTFNAIIIILLTLGRGFFKPRIYRTILVSCGGFMVLFGIMFIYLGLTGQMPVTL